MTRQYRGKKSYRPRPSSKTRFWYIGKRNKNNEIIGLLIAGALVGGGAWSSLSSSSQALLVVLLVVLVGILFVGTFAFVAFLRYRQRQKLRALSAAQVDNMDGFQFEHYVGALLQHQGYSHVQITQASGDFGVDVVASKGNQRWAIQAKRYNGAVGVEAIQQVFAGCAYYQCQRGMVITTSLFTAAAKKMAARNNVLLIDRNKLAEWIVSFTNKRPKF